MFKLFEGFVFNIRFNSVWKPIDSIPQGVGVTIPSNPNGWWNQKELVYFEVDNIKPYRLYLARGNDKKFCSKILQAKYLSIRVIGEPLQLYGFGFAKGTERVLTPVVEERIKHLFYDPAELVEV